MRYIVCLLAILNVGIWTYFNQDFFYQTPIQASRVEIEPDKIHLLSDHQLNALPKIKPAPIEENPAASENTVNVVSEAEKTSCFEWGIFNQSNIDDAQTTAAKLLLQASLKEHSSSDAKRYWVYLPKLKNTQAAEEKAEELKSLGITDLYILQDAKWKNAISFGMFEDETLATKLLEDIKAKGVKNVVKAAKTQGGGSYSLLIKNARANDYKNLKEVKSDFPEANVKEVACS